MAMDADEVTRLVVEFCERRGVADGARFRTVPSLNAAFEVLALKGPDRRWKTIACRHAGDDLPPATPSGDSSQAHRRAFDHALRDYYLREGGGLTRPAFAWCVRHVVVSAQHWSRVSQTIRTAHGLGLGWMVPANKDVLIVPSPTMRFLEDRPTVLHDDTGLKAVEWVDGTGFHFLRGTLFSSRLYADTINGRVGLGQISALPDADQRSIALSYMTFERLVSRSGAVLLNVGPKGTALYCLKLPSSIARDRVRGYGGFDYFIHMRDASHPEREFVEWVDPSVAVHGNAELCQAHAFGISLSEWLSIEQEG